ncbi:MAG: hypothetical protein KKE36_05245 [Actinobacteria bacterium]|nr:hypothetical protein [Actinomycetota bacterium]
MKRLAVVTVLFALIISIAVFSGGLSRERVDALKENAEKFDLIGQLKKLNKEVGGLNDKTVDLVGVIRALDEKESQMATSVSLLKSVKAGTQSQISTITVLSGIVGGQRSNVAGVLSVAQQVLDKECGLKAGTEKQLGMADTTLELINALYGNLDSFRAINEGINRKMDRVLDIMSDM